MKLIVTGGAGFIGTNLINYLNKLNKYEILILDKRDISNSFHALNSIIKSSDSSIHYKNIDLGLNTDLEEIFFDFKPDSILHLAAESHVDRSIDRPDNFIHSNIVGTFNLLEGFREYFYRINSNLRKKIKFLHISTDEVFGSLGPDDVPFNESNSYKPSSPYSSSKAASDHLAHAWFHTYNLPIIITNCSNNYGPYQYPDKLIPLMIQKALSGESLPVYGDGKNIRDWLFVEDHIRALICVLEKGKAGENYNIGGNHELDNISLVNQICNILDKHKPAKASYKDRIEFVKDRPGHDFRYAINSNKITKELSWQPAESFENGIEKTVLWYLNNQDWCINTCKYSYNGERLGVIND